ncbi:MAG: hypothetical protein WBM03_10025 [Steroidobacteraceae bacterium]
MSLRKVIRHAQEQSWTAKESSARARAGRSCSRSTGVQLETLLECRSPLSEAEAQAVLDSWMAAPDLLSELRFWIATQESGIVIPGGFRGTAAAMSEQVRDEPGK